MAAMTHTATFFIFIWMLAAMTAGVSSFILDAQKCLALSPCTCYGTIVYCNSKSLSTMPKFEISNVTGSYIYMYLHSNQLTSIPANAFRNLTVANNTNVYMYLHSNHLNNIATNAFAGIASSVTYLQLDNNNFTSLPSELMTLSKLQILYIQGNPISSLNPSIMRALGRHLTDIYIDLKHFSTWPSELNLLTSLTSLYANYLNTSILDYDAFDGFENTLTTLSIQYSQLTRIPIAVCHLHNLQSITFSYNDNVHVNSTVLEPCSRELYSVTTVNFQSNNLRYVPDVFRVFPSMTTLYLRYNKLSFVHADTITNYHPLTVIYMDNNDFTRIPSAITKLHALTQVYMTNNKITSVEDFDFIYLSRLQYLDLSYNPIEYISPIAFKQNTALYNLNLQRTNLRHLSRSMTGLHNLRYLYLDGSPIECSCDMSFLKPLNVTRINMNGNCHTSSLQVKTYMHDDLPNCP